MEAEYQKLNTFPSFKQYRIDTAATSSCSWQESEIDEIPRYQKMRSVPSFKHAMESSSSPEFSREGSESEELPRYTSLKDVMAGSSPRGSGSEPSIRNELVKHAASAYVLSATVIMPEINRDRDSRMKMCWVGFVSCWQVHVGSLCWPLVDFFYLSVHRIRSALRGCWR